VLRRFERIKAAAAAHSYRVLFLGDSLTQRWDEVPEDHAIWQRYFGAFDALNAGINGDRTEHLLWRIEHGNLTNQQPRAIVLLIGTNDLGHPRPVEDAAEGVRQILIELRRQLPQTHILLEGLWPRIDRPHLETEIEPVNSLIRECDDRQHIVYIDPGSALRDPVGVVTRAIEPDGLHPSPAGYARVSPEIAHDLLWVVPQR
jgi:lysophospholipase L1-like esterase